jgi:hypothetical protein
VEAKTLLDLAHHLSHQLDALGWSPFDLNLLPMQRVVKDFDEQPRTAIVIAWGLASAIGLSLRSRC